MLSKEDLIKISKEAEDKIFLENIEEIENELLEKSAKEGEYYLSYPVKNKKMGKRLCNYFKNRNFKCSCDIDYSYFIIISWEK